MDFQALVHSRRSVRGFKNEAVPKTVIREIIEDAKRAPSSMKSQPWLVHVLTGEPLVSWSTRSPISNRAGRGLNILAGINLPTLEIEAGVHHVGTVHVQNRRARFILRRGGIWSE